MLITSSMYSQEVTDDLAHIKLISRRRGAVVNDAGYKPRETFIGIPVSASTPGKTSIDRQLTDAIAKMRRCLGSEQKDRWQKQWQNAITCYNQANTDSITVVSDQVDWILLCGAFERILDASPKARDVAINFSSILDSTSAKEFEEREKSSKRNIQEKQKTKDLSYV